MFRIGLKLANYNLTKIEGCLKLLQLTPPTTKKEIKSKYFEFAKQLHPDIKDASGSPPNPKELQKRSESFIEITKAYKYLSELSENQINNPASEPDEYFDSNGKESYQESSSSEYSKPLTPEERTRRATYAYFNRRYRKQAQEQPEQKKEPLYRQLPELFLGCLFVAVFFLEWGYTAAKRSARNVEATKKEDHMQVFSGISFKTRSEGHIQ